MTSDTMMAHQPRRSNAPPMPLIGVFRRQGKQCDVGNFELFDQILHEDIVLAKAARAGTRCHEIDGYVTRVTVVVT